MLSSSSSGRSGRCACRHPTRRDPRGHPRRAALVAKSGRFFDLLRESGHAEEFLDENNRLCGDLSAEASSTHARLLTRMFARAAAAGEVSLGAAGLSAAQAADLLLATAEGIKARGRTMLSTDAYRERLGQAVRILIAGLAPSAARRAERGRRSRAATRR
jgi:hypothetical protein